MRHLHSLERRSVRNASQVGFLEDNLLIPEGWSDTNPAWWCKTPPVFQTLRCPH